MMRNVALLETETVEIDAVFEHIDSLRSRAMMLERNPWDGGDLVQDTIERALRSHIPVPAGPTLRSWLMRVMFNLFIDRCRRRTRELGMDPVDTVDIPAPAPYRPTAWENITHDDVRHAMSCLEHPFSEVLRLRHQEGRSYREISRLLDIPEATVGTRLLRARKKVRHILRPAKTPSGEMIL